MTHYNDSIASKDPFAASKQHYDILLIGSGILGSSLAYSLANSGRKILVIERDLSLPDRIVGELLQPGGCIALDKLGLGDCLEGIDAVKVEGYEVFWGGDRVEIPYPDEFRGMRWSNNPSNINDNNEDNSVERKQEGRSFHHGRFVQNLRRKAAAASEVTLIEGTVNELVGIESGSVTGVTCTAKPQLADGSLGEKEQFNYSADLTIVTDGCFSKFRRDLLPSHIAPIVRSNFVGLLLEDADLPSPYHGHVILRKGDANEVVEEEVLDSKGRKGPGNVGPVLIYQLSTHETRMLIDIPGAKVPSSSNGDLTKYLLKHVAPVLPPPVLPSFLQAIAKSDPAYFINNPIDTSVGEDPLATKHDYRIRSMPNSYLPAYPQGRSTPGVILAGDSMNMRHPLTGGGMSVALNDCLLLTELLGGGKPVGIIEGDVRGQLELSEKKGAKWDDVKARLEEWHWRRKGLSSTINVLAQALYSLFGADDENLEVLKTGCFKYFELGGECVGGPVSLLSALKPSPMLLIYHFFSVAIYSIYILFTNPVLQRRSYTPPATPVLSPSSISLELVDIDSAPETSSNSDLSEQSNLIEINGKMMEDVLLPPSLAAYPALTVKSVKVFWTALVVLAPVLWNEGQM